MFTQLRVIFLFAFLVCFSCEGIAKDLEVQDIQRVKVEKKGKKEREKEEKKVNEEKKVKKKGLNRYLLPEEHPLHAKLKTLFTDPQMFQSTENFRNAGFHVICGHRQLMVGSHPSMPNFLIKKFTDARPKNWQLDNYVKRIKGANVLRRYITRHHYNHLVVPRKWLYELPPTFNGEGKTKAYVLIVDKMDIFNDWRNPSGEARRRYYMMDRVTLTQLCTTLHELGGCDAYPRNQPFIRSGQIAFVDTEHLGKLKGHFIKHIVPALNEENQSYALALWDELEAKSQR